MMRDKDPESATSRPGRSSGAARLGAFLLGGGMFAASLYAVMYFYASNFPTMTYEGSWCDINPFLNCDVIAYSTVANIRGVPLGYFGMFVGVVVCLGAIFPSPDFGRTNNTVALLNVLGVAGHSLYSLVYSGTLCVPCAVYYTFSGALLILLWRFDVYRRGAPGLTGFLRPCFKYSATFVVTAFLGAYGLSVFYAFNKGVHSGNGAAPVLARFFSLPEVKSPSIVSPYMVVQATDRFEDAPVRVVVYGDFLCGDCVLLYRQMKRLATEFDGKLNVAFQFFPLDAQCNDVVDKNSHPGSCSLSYIAAHDVDKFRRIYDEIFSNHQSARDERWRVRLARKYGVEAALTDPSTQGLVRRILRTGAEYEKTSDRWKHGVRSTPTMIVNNRMLIGTFPYSHLRTIFAALVERHESAPGDERRNKFMEHWVLG